MTTVTIDMGDVVDRWAHVVAESRRRGGFGRIEAANHVLSSMLLQVHYSDGLAKAWWPRIDRAFSDWCRANPNWEVPRGAQRLAQTMKLYLESLEPEGDTTGDRGRLD